MGLIELNSWPVNVVLKLLLTDKTTKQNILWATNNYADLAQGCGANDQITADLFAIAGATIIQPRVEKSLEAQANRTKEKAEVFTPVWICNMMNNMCDDEWFGRPGVFNTQTDKTYVVNDEPISFPEGKMWKDYVDSRRMEITCGEAPFLVSRYDTATGESIPIHDRIGQLDRKIRVINENAADEKEWYYWTVRAYQSVYGYEYQGDSLLLARANLLLTFTENLKERWQRDATNKELREIANIIVWNIWQMDGFTDAVPGGEPEQEESQISVDSIINEMLSLNPEKETQIEEKPLCIIQDWRDKSPILFKKMKRGIYHEI